MIRKAIFLLSFFYSLFNSFTSYSQSVGVLYGLTFQGGAYSVGTLFSYDPVTNKETVVSSFNQSSNGSNPYGNLIQAKNGFLYGLCPYGGVHGSSFSGGVLYHFDIMKDTLSVDWSFPSNANDGNTPYNSLVEGRDGKLWGMTYVGQVLGSGAIFAYDPVASTESFCGYMRGATTGDYPSSNFIQATNGLLYGTGTMGGSAGDGTIFSFDPDSDDTTHLFSFSGTNGTTPRGSVIQAANGLLYGVTVTGGSAGEGVLYSYDTATGAQIVLVNFNGNNGSTPEESLMQAGDGNLYGLTNQGGTGTTKTGVLYRYNIATDSLTVLFNFDAAATGQSPYGDLIQASDSLLYGMTYLGGIYGLGVLFSYNLHTNIEKVLVNFNDTNGAYPYGDLMEAMVVSSVVHNNSCPNDSGGSIKVNVRGAKPAITYLWNNGATTDSISHLKSGPYTCIVTDGRGITFTIYDTVKPAPMVFLFQYGNACLGSSKDSTVVSVLGGTAPFTYSWSNGQIGDTLRNVTTGIYTVTITDSNGCRATSAVSVQQSDTIKITGVTITTTWCSYCLNGSITVHVTGGIPPGDSVYYYYLWSNGGSDSATLANIGVDTFAVCVTSPYGCGSICDSNLIIMVGVQNPSSLKNQVHIYPNPSNGAFSLMLNGEGFEELELTDIVGRTIYYQKLNPDTPDYSTQLNISNQPVGVYLLHITSTKGVITEKVIVQK